MKIKVVIKRKPSPQSLQSALSAALNYLRDQLEGSNFQTPEIGKKGLAND